MKTLKLTTPLTVLVLAIALGGITLAYGQGNSPAMKGQGKGYGQMVEQGQPYKKGRGMGQGLGMKQGKNRGRKDGQGRAFDSDYMPAFMAGWDSNEDGIVSLLEAKERRADLFAALDGDDNQLIDDAEFKDFLEGQEDQAAEEGAGHKRAMVGMSLDFNDLNQDGTVTEQEFVDQTEPWLARMDRNNDGDVTLADFGRGGGRGQGSGRGRNRN
ncbi:EF-hand domain-containing protein [Cohaesibacter gelatinilyticus]|uniref:EF-hand domain-containing protein n=1 Tax=Cohaesibacter gelatinilyticus TaxID=372072 RepID=A0A285NDJ7_9HYPH|nr:EF-hand domain-containing protein [Cohaesibacter gelatinilyticus]SNZ07027.1 hypothetical protein SAMN06265368_0621 [Cohaesibacter gelatinilyticus]